jgi:hypothetical protein
MIANKSVKLIVRDNVRRLTFSRSDQESFDTFTVSPTMKNGMLMLPAEFSKRIAEVMGYSFTVR